MFTLGEIVVRCRTSWRVNCGRSTCSAKMVISQGRKHPISFPRDACLHQNLHTETYSSHWQQQQKTIKLDIQPNLGTTGFWVAPHASPCGLFYCFSANKILLIFACVPVFNFYIAHKKDPHYLRIPGYHLGDHEGTLLHLRLVQVAPSWRGVPRKWPWLASTLMESALQESPSPDGLAVVELSGQPFSC
jgi:hypothetical protein